MIKLFIMLLLISITTFSFAKDLARPIDKPEETFQQWLISFKKKALAKGISTKTINSAFNGVSPNEEILALDSRQAEFFSTFWQYFNRAVSEIRIKKGQELYKKQLPQLTKITKKYGIPAEILVAFLGLETNYGSYTGNRPVIESLATLAYDKRRREFFSAELLSALKLIDKGYVNLVQMKGSWAGAIGQCQFMPSNYLRYAIDADDDGKKDLWNSLPDILNSMGNFLKKLGWQKNQDWAVEVTLPRKFDFSLADGRTEHSLKEWQKLGVGLAASKKIAQNMQQIPAKLVLPSNYQGPAFLVYKNFFIIKKWNNSTKYALAVGYLADRIVGLPPLSKAQPKGDKAISRKQIVELQQLLINKGYKLGDADGVAGSQTRQALRQYQKQHYMPADGYPSYKMLQIIRYNKSS